ncbi:MAG: outer membrane beta-barrel protein [Flavobacteriales bacterium]
MRYLIITLAMIVTPYLVKAQEGINFGAKYGYQNTWMLNKEDSDEGTELDYAKTFGSTYGLSMGYHFNETSGLKMDLLISKQGQKYDHYKDSSIAYQSERSVDYIKIPLYFSFNSDADNTVMFSAELGFYYSILNGSEVMVEDENVENPMKYSLRSQGISYKNSDSEDWEDVYSSSNFGGLIGFGVAFNIADHIRGFTKIRLEFAFNDAEEDQKAFDIQSNDTRRKDEITNQAVGGVQAGVRYFLSD